VTNTRTPDEQSPATVHTAAAIDSLGSVPLDGIDGVAHRVLWQDANSIAGVLTVAGGHHLGAHAHRVNEHHMWVVGGSATILGSVLEPGSYVHIPQGVEHDIDARASDGVTVFYLYIHRSPGG
jgi:uncharacterized RmlC-like cupin family protein